MRSLNVFVKGVVPVPGKVEVVPIPGKVKVMSMPDKVLDRGILYSLLLACLLIDNY